MDRSYEVGTLPPDEPETLTNEPGQKALEIINSRSRIGRPDREPGRSSPLPSSSNSSNGTSDFRGRPGIAGMTQWLQQIGYSTEDVNGLNVIHIAGTKGKGSTCAFTESFLRAHGRRTGCPAKTGLYTSPHLIHPEERIRLDSTPIDRQRFAKYFFELYDRLPQLHIPFDSGSKDVVSRGPGTLQLYALLAFHIFLREKVDVAIFETHSGGEYDATNVITKPAVTAITTLGMDHIATLGPRIENIAWHKAGIFKPGAAALSTVQDAENTVQVLKERASEKGGQVQFVGEDERLSKVAEQLEPSVQRQNASLALAAADAWLSRRAHGGQAELTSDHIREGVEQWSWPGRFQTVREGRHTWFLDAAHNEMSVAIAAQWFAEVAKVLTNDSAGPVARVLIFSHINELRDAEALLASLATALRDCKAGIQHVVFTTYSASDTKREESEGTVHDTEQLRKTWQDLHPETGIWDEPSIERALGCARSLANGATLQALITGSQHLVGPALQILQAD